MIIMMQCDGTDATMMIVVELIVMIDGRAEWPLFRYARKTLKRTDAS